MKKRDLFLKMLSTFEKGLRFFLQYKEPINPIQVPLPYIENTIRLQQSKMRHNIFFEDITRNNHSLQEQIEFAKQQMSLKMSKAIIDNNFGHLMIEKDERNQCYRLDFLFFTGIDQRLYEKSIKSNDIYRN